MISGSGVETGKQWTSSLPVVTDAVQPVNELGVATVKPQVSVVLSAKADAPQPGSGKKVRKALFQTDSDMQMVSEKVGCDVVVVVTGIGEQSEGIYTVIEEQNIGMEEQNIGEDKKDEAGHAGTPR